jgi:hypothetical protein
MQYLVKIKKYQYIFTRSIIFSFVVMYVETVSTVSRMFFIS